MAYTPTTWNTGDTITASAMNKLENGVANAGSSLICNAEYDSVSGYVLDKTAQEIYEALSTGTPAYIKCQYGVFGTDYIYQLFLAPITNIYTYNTTNTIKVVASRPAYIGTIGSSHFLHSPATLMFTASGLSDYPIKEKNVYVPSANAGVNESLY